MISAVDFLQDEILKDRIIKAKSIKEWNDIINKARKMEKQQIIDSFKVGCQVESTRLIGYHSMAEQYYNTTYKQNANTTTK